MSLIIDLFTSQSGVSTQPMSGISLPSKYKVLGGGSMDSGNTSGPGNLLTASFPPSIQGGWESVGRDHESPSPGSMTTFVLALYDPQDEWDVVLAQNTSELVQHPAALATLPEGYVLTGGGAYVQSSTMGNFLTASYPLGESSWQASSKDQDVAAPATITVFAIGMKYRGTGVTLTHRIKSVTSSVAAHASAKACMDDGFILSGGGAFDNWSGAGNFLTGSYPALDSSNKTQCWFAQGQDHLHSSPAAITAYAIGLAISSSSNPVNPILPVGPSR